MLRERVKLPSCAKWVEPNDPEGVCGYTLGILFEKSEQAVKSIRADIGLGGMAAEATRGVRDWHVFWNWEHIIEQKTATEEGCPFACPHAGPLPEYSVDMCPGTRDIIMRLAVISIEPGWEKESVEGFAEKLSKDLNSLFGGANS